MSVSHFYGARLSGLANRLPLSARRVVRRNDDFSEWTETRLIDASWDWTEEDGTRAVGTLFSLIPETLVRTLGDDDALAQLAPVRWREAPVRRELPMTDGTVFSGVVVRGELEGFHHGAKAWLGHIPGTSTVLQLIAAVRGERGYVLPETLDALFENSVKHAALGMAPGGMPPLGLVTPRVHFLSGAIIDDCTGSAWAGASLEGQAFDYSEVPSGLWDVAEYSSDIVGLDAKGRFGFLKSFAKQAEITRKKRHFAGLDSVAPVDLWLTKDEAGFVLVRDGVLHLARWQDQNVAFVEAALDSLSFHSPRHRLHKLLDEGAARFDETAMFCVAPEPLTTRVKGAR